MLNKDLSLPKGKANKDLTSEALIELIEQARKELQQCSEYFELVEEPILIDYAIYKEAAAKARYVFLLAEARKLGIKVNNFITYNYKDKAN